MKKDYRLNFVIFIFFLIFLGIVFRLYQLQIKEGNFWKLKASLQVKAVEELKPIWRGDIFIHQKENLIPVAISKEFFACFIIPKEIKEKEKTAKTLKEIFPEIEYKEILKKVKKENDPYELIKRKLSQEEVEKIKNLNLKGVYLEKKIERYYPFSNLLSHTLGFVSLDENGRWKGRYGIEAYYDKELSEGKDLILTIEKDIQEKSYEILKNLIESQEAEGGQIIVMDPKTGKVLSMVSLPDFDPNYYFKFPIKNFLNPCHQGIYEPGSVMKVITIASALESKKVSLEDKYYDKGEVKIKDKVIKNWDKKGYGEIDIKEILEHSINTGAVWVARTLGKDLFLKYLKKFNFDKKTGIDLPGEIKGSLKQLKKGGEVALATASFGQGISVTPIQLISALSGIANKGKMMKPYLVEKIIFPDGKTKENSPKVIANPISEETANTLTELLVNAVEKNILGIVKGYQLAGKTGTAQIPFKGKYLDEYIHSYVGFGPAKNPKFIILIKLDKPKKATLSGFTVVPAFKKLAQFLLNYYNIPPNNV